MGGKERGSLAPQSPGAVGAACWALCCSLRGPWRAWLQLFNLKCLTARSRGKEKETRPRSFSLLLFLMQSVQSLGNLIYSRGQRGIGS